MACLASPGLHHILRASPYDGFILDQFGVLHDGKHSFQAAVHAVTELRKRGAKILLLSNSSRRSSVSVAMLQSLGFQSHLFDCVITSGELAHHYLLNQVQPHSRVFHINWLTRGSVDISPYPIQILPSTFEFEGISLPEPTQIDLVVCHGIEAVSQPDGTVLPVPLDVLKRFVSHIARVTSGNVPLVCCNPDLVTVDGGVLRNMPGQIAESYSDAGGRVVLLGKPHAFREAVNKLKELGATKILGVGDSLIHDVQGAASTHEVDSLYIAGGIDADAFGLTSASTQLESPFEYSKELLDTLKAKQAPNLPAESPNFVMAHFCPQALVLKFHSIALTQRIVEAPTYLYWKVLETSAIGLPARARSRANMSSAEKCAFAPSAVGVTFRPKRGRLALGESASSNLQAVRRYSPSRRVVACVEEAPSWKLIDVDVEASSKLVQLEEELDKAWYQDDEVRMAELRQEIDKLQPSTYVDILQANLKFYKAFSTGESTEVARCWLQDKDVMCKHPLGPMHIGFWDVISSFEQLFNAGITDMRPDNVRISVRGTMALVTCEEYSVPDISDEESASTAATVSKYNPNFSPEPAQLRFTAVNIFEKRNGRYNLVYHMSSPITPLFD